MDRHWITRTLLYIVSAAIIATLCASSTFAPLLWGLLLGIAVTTFSIYCWPWFRKTPGDSFDMSCLRDDLHQSLAIMFYMRWFSVLVIAISCNSGSHILLAIFVAAMFLLLGSLMPKRIAGLRTKLEAAQPENGIYI